MSFTKKDLWFSIFTGAGTGLIAWRILNFLDIFVYPFGARFTQYDNCYGAVCTNTIYPTYISWGWLVFIIPILWILGVNLGYFLGKWVGFFNQFGKFAVIGFTNAAVDFGVLNSLIAATGIATGSYYSFFKTISFLVALINSYLLNKYWAFAVPVPDVAPQRVERPSSRLEFTKFAGVAIVAALINVGVASYVVNSIDPLFGFTPAVWANVGAIIGSAFALIFSFIGFKVLVFRSNGSIQKISA